MPDEEITKHELPDGDYDITGLLQAQVKSCEETSRDVYEALNAIISHFRRLDKLYSKDLEMLNLGSQALAKAGKE